MRRPLSAARPSCPSVFPNRISVSGDSITPRAKARNTTVYIWFVSPPDPRLTACQHRGFWPLQQTGYRDWPGVCFAAQGFLAAHGLAALGFRAHGLAACATVVAGVTGVELTS